MARDSFRSMLEQLPGDTSIALLPVMELLLKASELQEKGETAKAIHLIENCLALSRASNLRIGIALASLELGKLVRPNDPYRALDCYNEGIDAAKEVGMGMNGIIGNILHNMGTAYLQLQEFGSAEQYLRQSVNIRREIGEQGELANALANLGVALIQQKKWDEAYMIGAQAKDIYERIKDEYGLARVLVNLGSVEGARGNLEEAIDLYDKAEQILEILKAPEWAGVHERLMMLRRVVGKK